MINRKNKICIECGKDDEPWFSKKRCKSCAQKSYHSKSKKTKIESRGTLSPYFTYHLEQIAKNPICSFCKGRLYGSIAEVMHLLPKSKYPSVANNFDNAIYGCTSEGCHDSFDKNQNDPEFLEHLPNLSEMLYKFKKIKPFVVEVEKKEFRILNDLYEQLT